jgi:hypothetical protein
MGVPGEEGPVDMKKVAVLAALPPCCFSFFELDNDPCPGCLLAGVVTPVTEASESELGESYTEASFFLPGLLHVWALYSGVTGIRWCSDELWRIGGNGGFCGVDGGGCDMMAEFDEFPGGPRLQLFSGDVDPGSLPPSG